MRTSTFLAGALVVATIVGCGKSDQLACVPVQGSLVIDNKPFGPCSIAFSAKDPKIPNAGGIVAADGTFKVSAYRGKDGLPEGTYKVSLAADPSNPGTPPPLVKPSEVQVTKGEGGVAKLEVKLESTGRGRASVIPNPNAPVAGPTPVRIPPPPRR